MEDNKKRGPKVKRCYLRIPEEWRLRTSKMKFSVKNVIVCIS